MGRSKRNNCEEEEYISKLMVQISGACLRQSRKVVVERFRDENVNSHIFYFRATTLMQHTDVLELNACISFLRTGKEVPYAEFSSLHDMTRTFSDSRDANITALFANSPPAAQQDGVESTAWLATPQEIKMDLQRRQKEKEMDDLRALRASTQQQPVQQQQIPAVLASPKPVAPSVITFQRRIVTPNNKPVQSALTLDLQRATMGGGVVTGGGATQAAAAKNGPSCKLTIFLPDRTPFEIRVSKTATVEHAIAAVLERTLIDGKRRRNAKGFEMRMHDEDGLPDEDFPALDASQNIAEIGADEFCLVDLHGPEADLPPSAAAAATAAAATAAAAPSSQRKQSLSKAGVIHVEFVDIEHHDQRGSSQKVDAMDSRAAMFLKKVVKAVQLPLIADEYQFHVTEQDRERLQMVSTVVHSNDDVLALGVEVLLLRKRRYADAPPDVEAVLGGKAAAAITATAAIPMVTAAAMAQRTPDDHTPPPALGYKHSALKSSATKKLPSMSNNNSAAAATAAAAINKTSNNSALLVKHSFAGVDPNTILLNEIKAAVYEEWRVVKTNNWGKRQNRVLGIDLTKIYNKSQGTSSGRVKNAERLIADVVSIELNPHNAAAFTIKAKDTGISGGLVTLNYEAEEGADDAARIVAKVKYLMGGRQTRN